MNPLDRNHDGKVDLNDLTGRPAQTGLVGQQPLLANQGMVGGAHVNPLDRNHDGRVDLNDLTGRPAQTGLPLDRNRDGIDDRLQNGTHHNPLDRNHDGRVDAADFTGRRLSQGYDATLLNQQGVYVQSERRASLVRAEPTIIETIQKDVVVHERIHPVQKEEIQPIIYREREQLDVKQVTQMLHETQIQPTLVQQRELPAERREAIIERGAPIQENYIAPRSTVDATLRTQVVHAPIVNEVIKKTIIEEIQPVLERDIIQSTVIQNTQPIYEKIVEAPTVYRETIINTTQERRISGGSLEALQAQGFNLGAYQTTLPLGTTAAPLGTSALPLGTTTTTYTSTETVLNTDSGLRRRSLVEALPASYSYLGNGADAKLLEQEALRNNNAALPAKTLL